MIFSNLLVSLPDAETSKGVGEKIRGLSTWKQACLVKRNSRRHQIKLDLAVKGWPAHNGMSGELGNSIEEIRGELAFSFVCPDSTTLFGLSFQLPTSKGQTPDCVQSPCTFQRAKVQE